MSLIALEFACPDHGRFDATHERSSAPDSMPCPQCGRDSPWVISAPMGRVKLGEVSRGKSDAPPPNVMDTRALGEGMPVSEWRAQREKQHNETRHRRVKEMAS